MRSNVQVVLTAVVIASSCFLGSETAAGSQRGQANGLLRAQQAIGGNRIAQVKSLQIKGLTESGKAVSATEIYVRFPDGYLKVEENERFGNRKRIGFVGTQPIFQIEATRPGTTVSATAPSPSHVAEQRIQAVMLTLGALADAKGFAGVTRVETVSPKTLRVTGSGLDVFVDVNESGIPLTLRYQGDVSAPVLQRGGNAAVASFSTKRDEITWHFEDRRPVGDVLLPHRIRRTAPGMVLDELRIEKWLVNPKLADEVFRGK